MAVPARSESLLATRTQSAGAANDGYGSLMGMGAPRKKKKPVLVLDPDELAKAHLAMAEGGAQIMEEAGEHDPAERQTPPVSLLGLAPMGADDAETEDASAYPPIPDASSWEDDEPALPEIPEDYTDEGELDEEDEAYSPPLNLEQMLRPAAPKPAAEEQRASVIPSIEEQLKRMRALPTPEAEAEAEPEAAPAAADQPRRPGPMERLDELGFGEFGLPRLAGEKPEEQEAAAPEEPLEDSAQEPFELEVAQELPAEPEPEAAPEPEPLAEEEPLDLDMLAEPHEEVAAEDVRGEPADEGTPFEDFDGGPDLSWMEPEQRRELHIAKGTHSSLRARLVSAEVAEEEAPPPSLLARLGAWIAGLFGR